MSLSQKLDAILNKFDEVEKKLQDPSALGSDFAKISKEHSDLTPIVEIINRYQKTDNEINGLEEALPETDDAEMKEMMNEELGILKKDLPTIEQELKVALLPKDEADEKNAILEVRAGTGGEEAALFANKLFAMYQRYAEKNRWKFEVLEVSETGIGGYKDASALISGKNVFAKLKFESGVHRVQRVPETESSGRVHTSAATVAVLPEAQDVDVKLEEKDLKIDVYRSSGPGGQSVNTTDSAVRITHLPTGVTVSMQDEKSQIKNREKAMKVLRSRIYEAERDRIHKEEAKNRKSQVGSGDRSERIRTYNFPQNRVTDHRINLTLYKIEEIMMGDLDEVVSELQTFDQTQKLAEVE